MVNRFKQMIELDGFLQHDRIFDPLFQGWRRNSGDHNDGGVNSIFVPETSRKSFPIHNGHMKIEQYEIRLMMVDEFQRDEPVRGDRNLEPFISQKKFEDERYFRIIFND